MILEKWWTPVKIKKLEAGIFAWSKPGQEAADLPRREALNLKKLESFMLFDIII